MPSYRSDMFQLQVSVAGVNIDTISWDSVEGGELQSDDTSFNPGGMQPQIALGGKRSRSAMTVKRIWSDALLGSYVALDNVAGNAPVTISVQTLSASKQPVGSPLVYTGILQTCTRPGFDSSSSSVVYLQLVVGMNEALS